MNNLTKKDKSKKFLKVFCIVFLVILFLLVALAIWQRDNIKVIVDGFKYSNEELATKIDDSRADTNKLLQQYHVPVARDFTIEEEEEIRKGKVTVEEAVAKILKENSSQAKDTNNTNSSSTNTNNGTGTSVNPADAIVGKYVPELYSLKAYYIGQLGELERKIKSQYKTSGKKDTSIKASIMKQNLGVVASIEDECDSRVEAILSNMEKELKGVNADTSVVEVIRDSYFREKALKKSYYLSLYN